MRVTKTELDYARPMSLFLVGEQFEAIYGSKAWPRVMEDFATVPFKIKEAVEDVIALCKRGRAIYLGREDEDGSYLATSEQIDARIPAAHAWYVKVRNALELAVDMDVEGAEVLLSRARKAVDRERNTSLGARTMIEAILTLLASVDAATYYVPPELIAEGERQRAALADAALTQHGDRVEREYGTEDLEDICDRLRKRYLQIARANVRVADNIGREARGFDYGAIKADRPAGPAPAETPPASKPPPASKLPPMDPVDDEDEG